MCGWVELLMEYLYQDLAALLRFLDQPFRLGSVCSEGLFQKHMFTGGERFRDSFIVQAVGGRHVDHVDLRSVEQSLV